MKTDKKLTKRQRLSAYKKARAIFKASDSLIFLCHVMGNIYYGTKNWNFTSQEQMFSIFPELDKYKPNGFGGCNAWYQELSITDTEHLKRRIAVLNKCIRLLTPKKRL